MTPLNIGSLTPTQQKADVAASAQTVAAHAKSEPTPEQKKAAREFEAIFIRQLLSSLEKSSGVSGGESGGGAVFRSMMVGALADTAAEGGGIGLGDLILKAMLPEPPQGKPDVSQADPTSQMGTLHPRAVSTGLARPGMASRVLTEARSATILDDGLGSPAPLSSEGNGR
jgi:Rod binding domain-containing protein